MSDTDDHAIIALKNICDFVSTKMLIVMLEMKIPSGECRIAVIQGREDVTMPEQPYIYPFRDGQGYLCLFAYGQENPEYERKLRILLSISKQAKIIRSTNVSSGSCFEKLLINRQIKAELR